MPAPLLGFVCALRAEAASLGVAPGPAGDIAKIGSTGMCIVAGPGDRNAATGAARLIEAGVGALVSWGFAGSLHPYLTPGRLVLPRKVRIDDENGTVFDADDSLWTDVFEMAKQDLAPFSGDLVCAAGIVRTPPAKRRMFQTLGAPAVDMESGGIMRVARAHAVPSVVARAIVDADSLEIPSYIGADGRLGPIVAGLARKPASIAALIALADGYRRARSTLRKMARRMTK